MIDPKLKFQEWQKFAADDELSAIIILKEDGPANTICFLSQQMAEKYLKGFLVFSNKEFQKKHQLDYLLNLCELIDNSFKAITNEVKYLTEFYIETRYPGDYPEFSIKEAQKAYESAKAIKDFILGKIKY